MVGIFHSLINLFFKKNQKIQLGVSYNSARFQHFNNFGGYVVAVTSFHLSIKG